MEVQPRTLFKEKEVNFEDLENVFSTGPIYSPEFKDELTNRESSQKHPDLGQFDKNNVEQELKEMNEIYHCLAKKDSQNDDIPEDLRKAVYAKYGKEPDSDDDEDIEQFQKDYKVHSNEQFVLVSKNGKKGSGPKDPNEDYEGQNIHLNIHEDHFIDPCGKNEEKKEENGAAGTQPEEEDKGDEVENDCFNKVLGQPSFKREKRLCDIVEEVTLKDFETIRFLGNGAYGKVNLVKCKINDKQYAMKILDKEKISKRDKVENVFREKDIMFELDHPNICKLECAFQNESSLFFVLEYAPNGDLSGLIKKEKLKVELIRIFASEIINSLEELRTIKVVHRDLKPENILLDRNCHIKITDFGDSKKIDIDKVHIRLQRESFKPDVPYNENYSVDPEFEENFNIEPMNYEEPENEKEKNRERDNSFVGTPLYVSPEMLNHNLAAYSTDLWAFGCILYQCACGAPPFNGFTEQQIYDKIVNKKIFYPDFLDPVLKDLIDNLIQVDPKDRLGSAITKDNGIDKLKGHPFFEGIDFETVHKTTIEISEKYRKSLEAESKAGDHPFKSLNTVSGDFFNDSDVIPKAQEGGLKLQKNYTENDSKANQPKMPALKTAESAKLPMITKSDILLNCKGDVYKQSIVEKKNKWTFYQDRLLKLTKDFRLMYFKKEVYRGDITLSKQVSVRKVKIHEFEIITPHKLFHFRCKQGDSASEWVNLIKAVIKEKKRRDKEAGRK
ncbi:unnamed protein product [Moneuplotes crassus]|uniref:non-specific serine/threonine protein kinase n=1 Tax=Euplotes crassus TaxID=5936 RepID=A0AAD1U492_EUPCR|nr:unnamed protein product [Moneuplotes crassus]